MSDEDNVLAEAQALMDEIGGNVDSNGGETFGRAENAAAGDSMVIDGFSIDVEGSANRGSGIDARAKVDIGDDPLTAAAASMSLAPNPTRPVGTTPMVANNSLHPLQGGEIPKVPASPAIPQQNNSVSLADVKAKASGFASTISNFAQKAATTVAQAATEATKPNSALPSSAPIPTGPPRLQVELDADQKQALINLHLGNLLPGERVIMFLSNLLHVADSSGNEYSGVWHCCMTYYRVVLFNSAVNPMEASDIPPGWDAECWPSATNSKPTILQMPLSALDRVDKAVYTTTQNTTLLGLVLYGKDNLRQLRFTTPSYADTLRVHESIQTYAFPGRRNLGYLFAFESKRTEVMASIVTDPTGKKSITLPPTRSRYDAVQEFGRQFGNMQPCPWVLYENINGNSYSLCMSYPSKFVGPSSLPEASQETQRILRQSAAFRSEQRLPALTWSSGKDGASLWRASQPKVGLQGNRNAGDEFFLRHIMESAANSNSICLERMDVPSPEMLRKLTGQSEGFNLEPGVQLKIMDMRPRASAMANRTQGYGYENTSHYPGTTLQFCNIGNIHAVRDSYQKISNLCNNASATDTSWMSLVEDTKWLGHARLILAASWEAAFWVHVYRLPVLLHCSHGWDRTSQVAALAQLLLDPHYRTIEGFSCLIEKDFLSFGHPFHTRCGHGEGRGAEQGSGDEGQMSQIFMQFLDCVWQLVDLFPDRFEFNAMYLLVLSEHVYSCRFGTMLCDTERERELVAGIRQRTHSVWDFLESRPDCRNLKFQPSNGVMLMPLPMLLRSVSLWSDRHCMYGPKVSHRKPVSASTVVPGQE